MSVVGAARPTLPPLVIPGRGRPHEIVLSVYAVLVGGAYAAGVPLSAAARVVIPGGWVHVYGAALLAGGVLALLGSFWLSNVERGLDIERSGLIVLSGALIVYAGAVIGSAGLSGAFAGGMVLAWVWANLYRAVGITRDLATIRTVRQERDELA